MRPEYALYDDKKFPNRLMSLRQAARKDSSRADDEAAFHAFVTSYPVSYFSYKGYEQWQGSRAQYSVLKDLEDKKHITHAPCQ